MNESTRIKNWKTYNNLKNKSFLYSIKDHEKRMASMNIKYLSGYKSNNFETFAKFKEIGKFKNGIGQICNFLQYIS